MASTDKLTVTVSTEKLIHNQLVELAERAMREHGIQLIGVNFSWAVNIGGGAKVFMIKMDSASMVPMRNDDSESMN